ncbi:MAG: inositol phosphorylceramide synthase [Actinobacteria bacterium]|nr:inositol phosphorylceramide synthase [Actinomycetota bacterium]
MAVDSKEVRPMLLSWQTALKMAAALIAIAVSATRVRHRWAPAFVATTKELSLVLGLYALWQYAHDLAVNKTAGAMEHAMWLWNLERSMHLPSELSLQRALIDHKFVMQFLNVYYGGMHVPAVGILLIWLFFRHRERYSRVRTSLALMIAGCLTIQMIPMAPPRFLTDLGFVDAGLRYGLSVYGRGGSGMSNQLAAMPSQHVGWALVVGFAAVTISTSKWRWLVLLHPVLTILSVTATANHWWLDGVVAGMVLAVAYGAQRGVAAIQARLRSPVAALQ